MSRLEELIAELCPDGVDFIHLTEIAHVLYGYPFDSKLFTDNSECMPLIRIRDVVPAKAGTYYNGDVVEGYCIKKGDILLGMDGNFNLAKWNDRDGLLNQRVCKIHSKDENTLVLNGYLFHLLGPLFKKIEESITGSTVKHLSATKINSIIIPLPPLPVQQEIVRILDNFTELTVELTKELTKEFTARKKQYEYYRDFLFTFLNRSDVIYISVGELYEFKNGLNKNKEYFGKGTPIINFTDVFKNRYLSADMLKGRVNVNPKETVLYSAQKDDIFFTRTSETQDEIGMVSALIEDVESCVFSGFVLRARPKTNYLLPKYSSYCLSSNIIRKEIIKNSTYTTRALTSGTRLSKLIIPVPSLEEQARIVAILDRFDTLCNDLTSGLPAEIIARRKQYEYYRDKLLTFPARPAAGKEAKA